MKLDENFIVRHTISCAAVFPFAVELVFGKFPAASRREEHERFMSLNIIPTGGEHVMIALRVHSEYREVLDSFLSSEIPRRVSRTRRESSATIKRWKRDQATIHGVFESISEVDPIAWR